MSEALEKMRRKESFLQAMNFRHATKEYDKDRIISDEDFYYILEVGRLSPSSLGAEPWKFLVIQDQALREKMMLVAPGAAEKLKKASHFVVLLARIGVRYDSTYLHNHMRTVQQYPENMIGPTIERYKHFQQGKNILANEQALNDWSAKQTYIALGNMMTAAAMIGIDSTPMEGFQLDNLNALLKEEGLLEDGTYFASVLAAFGYRKADPTRPKMRKPLEEVVQFV